MIMNGLIVKSSRMSFFSVCWFGVARAGVIRRKLGVRTKGCINHSESTKSLACTVIGMPARDDRCLRYWALHK